VDRRVSGKNALCLDVYTIDKTHRAKYADG
jgi:hypothetical protein